MDIAPGWPGANLRLLTKGKESGIVRQACGEGVTAPSLCLSRTRVSAQELNILSEAFRESRVDDRDEHVCVCVCVCERERERERERKCMGSFILVISASRVIE